MAERTGKRATPRESQRPTRLRAPNGKPRKRFMSGGTSIANSPISKSVEERESDVELDSMIQSLEGRLAQLESWRMDDDGVSTPATAKSNGQERHNQLAASIRGMLDSGETGQKNPPRRTPRSGDGSTPAAGRWQLSSVPASASSGSSAGGAAAAESGELPRTSGTSGTSAEAEHNVVGQHTTSTMEQAGRCEHEGPGATPLDGAGPSSSSSGAAPGASSSALSSSSGAAAVSSPLGASGGTSNLGRVSSSDMKKPGTSAQQTEADVCSTEGEPRSSPADTVTTASPGGSKSSPLDSGRATSHQVGELNAAAAGMQGDPRSSISPHMAPELPRLRSEATNDIHLSLKRQTVTAASISRPMSSSAINASPGVVSGTSLSTAAVGGPSTSTAATNSTAFTAANVRASSSDARTLQRQRLRASPGESLNLSVCRLGPAGKPTGGAAARAMTPNSASSGSKLSQKASGSSSTSTSADEQGGVMGALRSGFSRFFGGAGTPANGRDVEGATAGDWIMESTGRTPSINIAGPVIDPAQRNSTESVVRSRKRTASFESIAGARGPQPRESRSADGVRYCPPARIQQLEPPVAMQSPEPPRVERFTMASRPTSVVTSTASRSTTANQRAKAAAAGAQETVCRNLLTDTTTVLSSAAGTPALTATGPENNAESLQRRVGFGDGAGPNTGVGGSGAPMRRSLLTEQIASDNGTLSQRACASMRSCGENVRGKVGAAADGMSRGCARKSQDCAEGAKTCSEGLHKIDTKLRDRKNSLVRDCDRKWGEATENSRACLLSLSDASSRGAKSCGQGTRACGDKAGASAKECGRKAGNSAKECGDVSAKKAARCCNLFGGGGSQGRTCMRDDIAFLSNLSTFFNISHVKVWAH